MNALRVLLSLSLAFNAGLLTLFIFLGSQGRPGDGHTARSETRAAVERDGRGGSETVELKGDAASNPGETTRGEGGPVAARSLGSTAALRQLSDDLLSIGYSPARAERIVLAVATGEWMAEMEALADTKDEAFWEAPPLNRHRELLTQTIERRRKYEATAAAALGAESAGLPSLFSMIAGTTAEGAPAEKRRDVMMIEEDYQLLRHRLQEHGIMLPEEVEALQMLEQERREDLLTVLTPEEMREYELRHSSTSQQLRQRLKAFQPTEEEFREIFELNRALDLEYGSPFVWTPADARRQRQQAEEELMGELRDTLGEERFADYARSQDFEYNALFNLAERLDLSRESVDEVYEMSRFVRDQQRELWADTALSEEDRREAAEILYEEVRSTLLETLGQGGVEVYKQYGGSWFEALETEARRGATQVADQ